MKNVKNINKLILIILLLTAFLIGCAAFTKYGKLEKSAKKNYQLGKYDTAFYQCASSLRINPKYDKAQILIQDVFKAATNQHENQIEQLKGSPAKFKWDDVVDHYEKLIKMNKEIETLPKLINKKTKETITIKTKSYYNEMLV